MYARDLGSYKKGLISQLSE